MAFLLPNFYPTLLVQTKFKHKPIHQTLSQIRPNSRNCSLSQLSSALQTSTLSEDAQVETSKGAQDKKNKQQRDDFYVNLGLAVRTLREDMPLIFAEDLNYDIYRDDITFMDPLNTFTGIENYKLIFWALRFHGKILFRDISLEIYRIWQPSENVILIRWNMKGVPRVPWEAKGEFQGSSRYKLDRKGKIYEHKVDNLAFNFPQKLQPASSVLDLVTACPASPKLTFLWGPDSCGCILIFMVGVLSSSQRNFKSRSFLASTRWFSKLMRYFTDILYIDFVSYMYTSLTFCTIY